MQPSHPVIAALGALLAIAAGAGSAAAAQLDKVACEALKTEEATLVTAGIKTDMDKGPEWAKTNLAPDRLQQVARYIELEEQISFRCRVLAVPVPKKGAKGSKAAAVHVAPDDPDASVAGAKILPVKPAAKPAVRRQTEPAVKVRKPKPQKTGLSSAQ